MLRPIKEKLGIKFICINCVPCDCKSLCWTDWQIHQTVHNENMRYVYLGQQEKSALAEHRFETWHHIDFSRTIILVKATGYTDHMIKEEAVTVASLSFSHGTQ